MPVAAVNWREDALHYATGGAAQALIRECESFFVHMIVFRFVYCLLSIFGIAFQYIKILSNVKMRSQVLWQPMCPLPERCSTWSMDLWFMEQPTHVTAILDIPFFSTLLNPLGLAHGSEYQTTS
jgi:hypothetical protein